jgi:uncharacterized membrane protein
MENKTDNQLEQKRYQELMSRQVGFLKRLIFAIFSVISLVFLILSVVFMALGMDNPTYNTLAIIYASVGVGLLFIGLLIYLLIPKNKEYNYQKFKKRIKRYGILTNFELCAMIAILDEKTKLLEKEITKLQEKNK